MAATQHKPRHVRRPDRPGGQGMWRPHPGSGMRFPMPPALDNNCFIVRVRRGGRQEK